MYNSNICLLSCVINRMCRKTSCFTASQSPNLHTPNQYSIHSRSQSRIHSTSKEPHHLMLSNGTTISSSTIVFPFILSFFQSLHYKQYHIYLNPYIHAIKQYSHYHMLTIFQSHNHHNNAIILSFNRSMLFNYINSRDFSQFSHSFQSPFRQFLPNLSTSASSPNHCQSRNPEEPIS